MLGQIDQLFAHAARIEHAREPTSSHAPTTGEQQRAQHHFIDIAAQQRTVTFTNGHHRLVVTDDRTRVASRQLRGLFGTAEPGNDHRHRLRLRFLQRGDK